MPPRDRRRTRWGAAAVAAAMLGLAAVHIGWRIVAPGTCALLSRTAAQWSETGLGRGVIGDCSPAERVAWAWSTILFVVSLFVVSGYAFLCRRTDPAAGALLLLASGLLAQHTVAVVGLPVRYALGGWPRSLFRRCSLPPTGRRQDCWWWQSFVNRSRAPLPW